ncbi:GNAT family N-acetyltransferase [Rhodococcus sp. HNM0563]|uniref:GNAT family N-acetyltransferase n=1 Tax=Rhodococcus sp. HNM0563 TaxID=2716339 RepID=UPI00146F3184|nr:GNAT family N-acetyltransferase [Rhodococcus sp. HNM0563]NLU62150.1 GNAT family N-acetyltransferase [Rhodococcus sp. HNM0563]
MSEHRDAEIRALESEEELRQAMALFRTAMVGLPSGPDYPEGRMGDYLEKGRTFGAFIDGALVGTVDATSGSLVLPGGERVSHAGVTHIGVLPTHTRRGVVTSLVHRQLRDAHERGDVVASLRASEATIYGRFGYGIASMSTTLEVERRRAVLHQGVPGGGPVRFAEFPDSWDLLERIYSEHATDRPGRIERTSFWWASQRFRASSGNGPAYVAVHGSPGAEDGFVRYRPENTGAWFGGRDRTIVVSDFFAPTAESHAGLVRFLLNLDLVDRIVFDGVPADDPLPWMLTDHRGAQVRSVSDETWLRILDVRRALEARSFVGVGTVRIAVTDPVFAENTAVFEISADGVSTANEPAHLELGIAELGSLLLGGVSCHALAGAGRITVHDPVALPVAEALFTWPVVPFAGTMF